MKHTGEEIGFANALHAPLPRCFMMIMAVTDTVRMLLDDEVSPEIRIGTREQQILGTENGRAVVARVVATGLFSARTVSDDTRKAEFQVGGSVVS